MKLQLIHEGALHGLHPMFAEWWKAHHFPVLPVYILNTMGLMVVDDDAKPLAACWVYTASSGLLAMLEWMVTRPGLAPGTAYKAVAKLVDFAAEECERRGYGAVFTVCRQPSLARIYEKSGFITTDANVTSMICLLSPNPPARENP